MQNVTIQNMALGSHVLFVAVRGISFPEKPPYRVLVNHRIVVVCGEPLDNNGNKSQY